MTTLLNIPISVLENSLPRNSSATIDTTSLQITQKLVGQTRKSLVITNTSTSSQIVTISEGQEAVFGNGIILYPQGTMVKSIDSGYIPSKSDYYAIADNAGATISIFEEIINGL